MGYQTKRLKNCCDICKSPKKNEFSDKLNCPEILPVVNKISLLSFSE